MHANPYAAPQTIHARFHAHELPMAEARGNADERRDFREFATTELTGFQQKSRAIDKAQFAWLLMVIVSIISLLVVMDSYKNLTGQIQFRDPQLYPWYFGFMLVVLRFCAGIDRRRWMRPLIVGMDAACVAVGAFCLFNPQFHQFILQRHENPYMPFIYSDYSRWYWCAIAAIIVVSYMVGKSGYAAFHAPELFSRHRYGHARLCQELDYRNEYGIE